MIGAALGSDDRRATVEELWSLQPFASASAASHETTANPIDQILEEEHRRLGLAPLPAIAKIIKDDFSTKAEHIVLKPKKKRFTPGLPLDYKEAICYDSDESSEGDLFDDLEVLGEEG